MITSPACARRPVEEVLLVAYSMTVRIQVRSVMSVCIHDTLVDDTTVDRDVELVSEVIARTGGDCNYSDGPVQ